MNTIKFATGKHVLVVPVVLALTSFFGPLAIGQGRNDLIVQTGQAAPNGNGTFSNLGISGPILNETGQVAFRGDLTGTSGGSADSRGIFRGAGGSLTQIIRNGQGVPGGNGTINETNFLFAMNNSGEVAVRCSLAGTSGGSADNEGIYRGSGGSLTQIARRGQAAPGNGTLGEFNINLNINGSGAVAFHGFLNGTSGGATDNTAIYLGTGGSLTQIAREGQAAPDGNGTLGNLAGFGLAAPLVNNFGTVAFRADINGTSGGTSDNAAIYRGTGGSLTQIARKGQAAPGGNGTLSNLDDVLMNNTGAVAFVGTLSGTSGGTSDDSAIYRGTGGSLTQIAREGQAAPDGNGSLGRLDFNGISAMNESGAVMFWTFLTGTTAGTNSGIFRGTGGSLTQIARTGQAAPDGNGTLSGIANLDHSMNDSGAVVFRGFFTGTSGGSADDSGIFVSDGIDFLTVSREGDSLSGSIVATYSDLSPEAMNNRGQVAYRTTLANGTSTIQRWTPDLHWRSTTSGTWDTNTRWTLGINPDLVHDVYIDPAASVTVSGPAGNTTVRQLQIGGGSGLARLNLQSGSTLTATNGVTILSTGTLSGDGTIGGNVTNNGTVEANNVTVTGTMTNNSVIEGSGRVHANIVNGASGEIRALSGNTMRLTGASFSNSGLVEVHGGELRVTSTLQNNSGSGLVSMRDGSLIANAGINNSGSIAFSQGSSTLRGDLSNTGTIQVSGGAHATFFDDVTQNGTMQVSRVGSTNSTAVILGAFTGSGGFTGGGDVFALGDLRPGNSPASVLYDGNLFLGNATDTFIELGGLNLGEFDQMRVTGDLSLSGDLLVSLINGHTLGAGQQYLIGEIGGVLSGQFNGLGEGALVGVFSGYQTFISYSAGNGNDIALITAIPEPSTPMLLALVSTLIFTRRRKSESAIA